MDCSIFWLWIMVMTSPLGFDGLPWHTHPECLPPFDSTDWQFKVNKFLEELMSDRLIIQILRKDGHISNAAVVEAPAEDKYLQPGEEYEFRYWSGRKYDGPVELKNSPK